LFHLARRRVPADPTAAAPGALSAVDFNEARLIALDIRDEVRIGRLDVGRSFIIQSGAWPSFTSSRW
jgi:hypothetical protein